MIRHRFFATVREKFVKPGTALRRSLLRGGDFWRNGLTTIAVIGSC